MGCIANLIAFWCILRCDSRRNKNNTNFVSGILGEFKKFLSWENPTTLRPIACRFPSSFISSKWKIKTNKIVYGRKSNFWIEVEWIYKYISYRSWKSYFFFLAFFGCAQIHVDIFCSAGLYLQFALFALFELGSLNKCKTAHDCNCKPPAARKRSPAIIRLNNFFKGPQRSFGNFIWIKFVICANGERTLSAVLYRDGYWAYCHRLLCSSAVDVTEEKKMKYSNYSIGLNESEYISIPSPVSCLGKMRRNINKIQLNWMHNGKNRDKKNEIRIVLNGKLNGTVEQAANVEVTCSTSICFYVKALASIFCKYKCWACYFTCDLTHTCYHLRTIGSQKHRPHCSHSSMSTLFIEHFFSLGLFVLLANFNEMQCDVSPIYSISFVRTRNKTY